MCIFISYCMPGACRSEGCQVLYNEVTDGCELRCWELNPTPLHGQQVLLTTELSLFSCNVWNLKLMTLAQKDGSSGKRSYCEA